MTHWTQVTWGNGGQVLEFIGRDADDIAADSHAALAPDQYCQVLIDRGDIIAAVEFLGHALPRYEAVVWAAQVLRRLTPGQDDMLTAVLRWIDDPNDAQRRAVYERAERLPNDSAKALLGNAVFYSGGSISGPDLPPVLPPAFACGKSAYGAVLKAAYATNEPDTILRDALRIGESIASGGVIA
ncbi:hypothetical protein [Novosphingobium sp. Chol11]|uniref:DUF6931 family protein n=1 Tax=Novosphingobium sp. Chol11 TaxID=1385763 RepID=UPI0025F24CAF|nr:hypothetical protein [Novosphingobium sp. Chol11]